MNRNKKIVMISPPAIALANQIRKTIPPFGLLTVGATVEERGYHDLLLIDSVVEGFDNVVPDSYDGFIKYGLDDEEIARRVEEYGADFVGITVLFSGMAECGYNVAKAIKRRLPDIPICMGGIHITAVNKQRLMTEQKSLDFVINGEGDKAFPDLLDEYFTKQNFASVRGLTWKFGNDIIENPREILIENLDTLPFPAWHKFYMEKYFDINIPFSPFVKSPRVGTIITSRGCPANCNFCFISWTAAKDRGDNKPYRTLSADYTIRMIQYLIENWGIKELQILDDSFTVDYHRCMKIFEGIKDFGLRIEFPNGIRADLPKNLDRRKKLYTAMREAGVWQVCYSPEHGNQDYLLNYIDKGMDLNQVISSCDIAHDNDFLVHSNFIMGFPEETKDLRNDTEQFARKLDADSFSFSFATPYPGTALYEEVKKKNLFVADYDKNRVMFDKVNIIPHDISEKGLFKHVENLNREINELAQDKRPELTKIKYDLLDKKVETKDKKYHHKKSEDNNYLPTTANYLKERIAGV